MDEECKIHPSQSLPELGLWFTRDLILLLCLCLVWNFGKVTLTLSLSSPNLENFVNYTMSWNKKYSSYSRFVNAFVPCPRWSETCSVCSGHQLQGQSLTDLGRSQALHPCRILLCMQAGSAESPQGSH